MCLACACWANDRGIEGVGGSFQLLQGEHSSIQMVSEDVRLDVRGRLVFTAAQFEFANHGSQAEVDMGFPESGHGDIDTGRLQKASAFLAFASLVDGIPAECRRVFVKEDPDRETYTAHWVKHVSFAPGARRSIRVEYVATAGTIAGGQHFAEYRFSGGNWQGKVRQSNIQVSIEPADYKLSEDNRQRWRRNRNRLAMSISDWQAEEWVSVVYEPGVQGYLCPNSDRMALTDADLKGRSARHLTLMRNEIYARFGRPFHDPQVRAYFQAQPWYREFPGYRDQLVSRACEKNARIISAYQTRHKLNW
ncbi:YARHG domain-containing protein [bacterium]|nr:YARHG domain-containing protein [bacterium]